MEDMIKVAIYARVSTAEQAEQGYSIEAQLETLETYCKQNHKLVYGKYIDAGVSGKSIKGRKDLHRLLKDAQEEKFKEVIVWKINRMARNTLDLLTIVETLEKHGVSFRSFSENFETATPMGKFALSMMGAVGELERKTLVENVKLGLEQRAKNGKWNGGTMLGYRSVPKYPDDPRSKETTLKIVPSEAMIVKRIFEMYAGGQGYKSIANELNHLGYRTRKNNPFGIIAVKNILDNVVYVGKVRYNVHKDWATKRRKGTNPNPIIADGEHEPIISQELWSKVQEIRKMKSYKANRTFDGNYTLTGLLKCPQCGSSMVIAHTKDRYGVRRRYYICGKFHNKGSAVCRSNSIKADYAEQFVYNRLREVVMHPNIIKDIVSRVNSYKKERIEPLTNELRVIEKELVQIEQKRKKYLTLYENDAIDNNMLIDRMNEIKECYANLTARKSLIEAELDASNLQPISHDHVKVVISKFSHLLDSANHEQKKTLLHLAIKRITLDPQRKIESIELQFNPELQKYFFALAPSNKMEGAFPLPPQLALVI